MTRPAKPRRGLPDDLLRHAVAIGATLVLLLPEARGDHPLLGWLPLWLLGMPLAAWAGLRLASLRDAAVPVALAVARGRVAVPRGRMAVAVANGRRSRGAARRRRPRAA